MNATINMKRIADLAVHIRALDSSIVERERDALEVLGSEADCTVNGANFTAAKADLERALRAYFIESEFIRLGRAERAAADVDPAMVDLQPSVDLHAAAQEEGLSVQKMKSVLRRIASKATGSRIFQAFLAERVRKSNAEARKGRRTGTDLATVSRPTTS